MEELDYTKIGAELKRLRLEKSYTQEQFAKKLGCTIAYISNVENNRAKLNLRTLMYYSKLCHASIDNILNVCTPEDSHNNPSLDSEMLNILHQFNHEEQIKIIKMVKYFKEIH